MDENNQYGNAMAKPLQYGCIKKMEKISSLREFNIMKIKLVTYLDNAF